MIIRINSYIFIMYFVVSEQNYWTSSGKLEVLGSSPDNVQFFSLTIKYIHNNNKTCVYINMSLGIGDRHFDPFSSN